MVDNLSLAPGTTPSDQLEFLGDEWSDKQSVLTVLNDFVYPNVTQDSIVAEIGSGGGTFVISQRWRHLRPLLTFAPPSAAGRIASKVSLNVKELTCFDISDEMLKKARAAVTKAHADAGRDLNTKFVLVPNSRIPENLVDHFDFIYAFDCFPHVDLRAYPPAPSLAIDHDHFFGSRNLTQTIQTDTQWKYYKDIKRALKPGGKALIHTASLETDQGWARFEKQEKYTVGGFYFMTPSQVRTMIIRCGLKLLKQSTEYNPDGRLGGSGCLYYDRDYLALVEKEFN